MRKLVFTIGAVAAYLATLLATPANAVDTTPAVKAVVVEDIVVCVTTSGDPFGCTSACVWVC